MVFALVLASIQFPRDTGQPVIVEHGAPFRFKSGPDARRRLCAGSGERFQKRGARAHDARFGLVYHFDALRDGS